jgi:hypothetical protein
LGIRKTVDNLPHLSLFHLLKSLSCLRFGLYVPLPDLVAQLKLIHIDMQLMRNPDIQGKEYQQGALAGYETRE